MFSRVSDFLKQRDVEFTEYEPIARHSTIRIGGAARIFAMPDTEDKLCGLVNYLYSNQLKYKVVGGLSNILFDDGTYDGIVVSMLKLSRKKAAENILYAECGTRTCDLFRFASALGLGGAEELAHIPGALGGLLYMNAGAFGRSISDIVQAVRVLDPKDSSIYTLSCSELAFSYRKSIFQDEPLLALSCELRLTYGDRDGICARMRSLGEKRRESQPLSKPSLGCVFKKVGQIGAGYYIDKAGLKGLRIGGAEVSTKHAGFIVNVGGATASDVRALIREIKLRVRELLDIRLEEEIEIFDGRS